MNQILNTVVNADCFDFLKQIPDCTVNLCVLDLPYNMCTTEKDWDKNVIDLDQLWKELKRVTTPTANIIFFGSQPFTSKVAMSNPKWFRYEIIYQKNTISNPGNAKRHVLKNHENILVFYKKFGTYNPQGLTVFDEPQLKKNGKSKRRIQHLNGVGETYYQYQTGYPKSVQYFKTERGLHGSQKPLPLLEWLIKTYSDENDIVLDVTAGSFGLAVAADNTKRNWLCCELDKEFCEVGKKRIEENKKRLSFEIASTEKFHYWEQKGQEIINEFLTGYTFNYIDNKNIYGSCDIENKIINISKYAVMFAEDEVEETIRHEIGHALAPFKPWHGKQWKELAVKVGYEPRAIAKVSLPERILKFEQITLNNNAYES